ncbi:MAG: hypothetical protein WCV55_00860 [Candidatus Paceibacterota bacterium]
MKFLTNPSIIIAGFVFLASVVPLLFFLLLPTLRALVFKKKIAELIRWSGENPNSYSTESKPLQIITSLDNLRKKLKGDWPRLVKRPVMVINLLRYLEAYPNSQIVVSGRALKKILSGKEISEYIHEKVILRVPPSNEVVTSP